MTTRGVAWQLWSAVENERLSRSWTAVRMAEHIGLPRNTISRLKTSPNRPLVVTVHTIADALGIDREKAEVLGGLREPLPEPGALSAREAIERDPAFTDEQRTTMLHLVDMILAANQRNGDRQAS